MVATEVIRATLGNWANYGTTLFAQILFAARFGSGREAAAYTLAFAIAAAVSGILVGVAQSVAIPRLVTASGALRRTVLAFLLRMAAAAVGAGALVALSASRLAELLGGSTGSTSTLNSLLAVSAAVLVARVLAGEAGLVAYSLGHRLAPATAPAIPSTAMVIAFVLVPRISALDVMLVFLAASFAEAVLLALFVAPKVVLVDATTEGVRSATLWLLLGVILLSLLPPIERVVVGIHSSADVARYDYAIRSLGAVQALITGGVAMAGMATWARLAGEDSRGLFGRSVAITTSVSSYVLVLTASAFLAVGSAMVAAVYQHGHFTATDTQVVTQIVLIALGGYWAQALSSVLTSALAAARHTRALAITGFTQFGSRLLLVIPLGVYGGVRGVAVAYSIGSLTQLAVALGFVFRSHLWNLPRVHRRLSFLASGIALAGGFCAMLWGASWGTGARVCLLVGVCLSTALVARIVRRAFPDRHPAWG